MIPIADQAIVLEKYKKLFKDEESFKEFVDRLCASQTGETLVTLGDKVIVSVLPGKETDRRLRRRLVKKLGG